MSDALCYKGSNYTGGLVLEDGGKEAITFFPKYIFHGCSKHGKILWFDTSHGWLVHPLGESTKPEHIAGQVPASVGKMQS